jgi:type IV pilus assembly protein PilX
MMRLIMQRPNPLSTQRGVVLIIALIMLVIISILATFSMRNATSTEKVSSNVRTTQLATQTAEIALRYCEDAVVQIQSGTVTLTSVPTILDYSNPPKWQDTAANWDVATSPAFVIPTTLINSSSGSATFNRAPECMVERMQVLDTGATAVTTTTTFVITARGFGPEVAAADAARSRPTGSEVWLQSIIELE